MPTTTRIEALMERLQDLSPERAADLDTKARESGREPSERYVESLVALAMERHLWTCSCGHRRELTVASNLDAPIPNPPVTIHDDEGQSTGWCPSGHELDLVTLVPMLVWHVAQAGTFGLVADDGTFVSADEYERCAVPDGWAEHAEMLAGGSGVVTRYRAFTDPAKAVEAAVRAMRRDPDDLIQIIPEALPALGAT